jgi:chloramphenicol O-acetyltransferase type A
MDFVDIKSWNRKEHYEFFSKYDDPYFGIVTEIDCTKAYEISKKNNFSFFAYYLHQSILAVNQVDELKFRIVDGKVVMFENIHAAATIGRADGTFGFSFINFSHDFKTFNSELKEEINNVQTSKGLRVNENAKRHDAIHYSTLPWHKFTGLTHSRNFSNKDSVPKITFGKIFTVENRKMLPISITAHHGLVDGLHVAQYLDEFQKLMNK